MQVLTEIIYSLISVFIKLSIPWFIFDLFYVILLSFEVWYVQWYFWVVAFRFCTEKRLNVRLQKVKH